MSYIDIFSMAAALNDLSSDGAHFKAPVEWEIAKYILTAVLSEDPPPA